MARYKFLDTLSQGFMLTINLADQLLPGTFEFTLNHLIDRADLIVFDAAYHNEGGAVVSVTIFSHAEIVRSLAARGHEVRVALETPSFGIYQKS
jgi:hypothetical protein